MIEPLANGYSSESTQRELSNEYQHDRVYVVFKNLCIFVFWTKVVIALEGLTYSCLENSKTSVIWTYCRFVNNFGIKSKLILYLKESCWLCPDDDFLFKCCPRFGFIREVSSYYQSFKGIFWHHRHG